jgi:hypothetical protein
MRYDEKMTDRQVGRNAELFAQSIGDIETREERYPYLRILVSLLEQAHPEWKQAPDKPRQIAELAEELSGGTLEVDEVEKVVQTRDREKGRR